MASGRAPIVEVNRVSKEFSSRKAVDRVSFTIEAEEVLGLVGPNGAGKTTTLRMLLGIIRPDEGEIRVFGAPLDEEAKGRIGYLPEERGLYRDLRVWEMLMYLAALKGVDSRTAGSAAGRLLEAVGLQGHRQSRVRELSRGMGQLVQFIATILHGPRLVVLDEPFAGLDPVNVRVIKAIIARLQTEGTTFILSTHQMNQVEEVCDRVVMIDGGEVVLEGRLQEVKHRFATNALRVSCDQMPEQLPGVRSLRNHGGYWELALEEGMRPQEILRALLERGVSVESYQVALPSLEEVFVKVVEGRR